MRQVLNHAGWTLTENLQPKRVVRSGGSFSLFLLIFLRYDVRSSSSDSNTLPPPLRCVHPPFSLCMAFFCSHSSQASFGCVPPSIFAFVCNLLFFGLEHTRLQCVPPFVFVWPSLSDSNTIPFSVAAPSLPPPPRALSPFKRRTDQIDQIDHDLDQIYHGILNLP